MKMKQMLEQCISVRPDGIRLSLHVHPGAKRNGISGFFGNSLKFELQAPPVDGKANSALLKYFSKITGCSKSTISIAAGELSRDKVIELIAISKEDLIKVLAGQIL